MSTLSWCCTMGTSSYCRTVGTSSKCCTMGTLGSWGSSSIKVVGQGLAWLSGTGDGEGTATGWPVSPLVRYSCARVGVLLPEAVTAGVSGREGRTGWLWTSSHVREAGRELADSWSISWLGEEGVSGVLCGSSMLGEKEWSGVLSVSTWQGGDGGPGWHGHS